MIVRSVRTHNDLAEKLTPGDIVSVNGELREIRSIECTITSESRHQTVYEIQFQNYATVPNSPNIERDATAKPS